MQRQSKSIAWRIKGLSDALDASDSMSFPGSMLSLQNLIPDPSTRDLWQCRPAAVSLINFATTGGPFSSGFSSGFQQGYFVGGAGAISVYKVVGNLVYGMIANPAIPGYDAPFCFNLSTGLAVAVTGTQSTTTLPVSQPTSNAWIPPQMDVIGVKLMVAHPGFTGAGGNYIGWFDLTTPTAPVWNAGNMTGDVTFTVAPIAVKQFNNRAYYIHNAAVQPAVIFSDALNATNATNANQVLTFNDNVQLTALGALPLNNLLGGIIQSIMVFKGVANIFQITGDAASSTNPLTVNALDVATGTLAPNTVVPCSQGLAFVAPDGVRFISFTGQVSDPLGNAGSGVTVPFIYSTVPSRMVACANGTHLRVTTQNGNLGTTPTYEYWYNFSRKIWSGPHTCAMSLLQPWNGTFIGALTGTVAQLFQSDPVQSNTSVFVENGTQLSWTAQTSLLPDTDQMTNVCMTETTLDLSLPPTSGSVTVVAADQNGTVINSVGITPPSSAGATIWGAFVWGAATWGGGVAAALTPYEVPWTLPLIFSRATLQATGMSLSGLKVGSWHLRYQVLRQFVNTASAA
jgi:hypothetical protein